MPLPTAFLLFVLLASVLVAHHSKGLRGDLRSSRPLGAAMFITLFILFNAAGALRSLQTGWTMSADAEGYISNGHSAPPPGRGALLAAQFVFIAGLLGAIHRIFRMALDADPALPMERLRMTWLTFRMLLDGVTTFVLILSALGGVFAVGALGGGPWAAPWRLIKEFLFTWPVMLFVILPALGRLIYGLIRKSRCFSP